MMKNIKHNAAQVAAPSNLSSSRADRFLRVYGVRNKQREDGGASPGPYLAFRRQEYKRREEGEETEGVRGGA